MENDVKKFKSLAAALLFVMPLALGAWPNYGTVSTPNFEVYYRRGWETEARNVLQALEYSRTYVEKLTGNSPGKVKVVLSDMGNTVNGYASPVGAKMGLYAYPPSSDELGLGEDWWQLVGVHEFIHMAQMTRATGEPALLRALFGNILYPNLYQPMWMTEGITVYGESQLSEQTGRLNAGTYPAIIGALAREGRLPNPGKACYYSYSNPLGNYYVYGSSFHQYLADKYGENKFSVLYGETSSSLAAYLNPISSSLSLDQAYRTAYGNDVATLWTEWQNDAASKSAPLPKQRLTEDGWNKENLKYHDGALYFTQRKTSKTGPSSSFTSYRLVRLDQLDGKPQDKVLIEQNSDFAAGYQLTRDKLYFTKAEYEPGYANNDADGLGVVTEVWSANLDGGNRRKLFAGPIRAFCHLDGDRFLVAEDNETHQGTKLFEISLDSGQKKQLGSLNHLIGSIDQSGGKIYVTARKFWQNNSIYLLNAGTMQLTPLIDTPNLESVAYIEGNTLVFNATYSGQNGCYAYDLNSRSVSRFTGYSEVKNAIRTSRGKTYFLSINGDGYDVYQDQLGSSGFSLPSALAAKPPYERLSGSKNTKILNKYPVIYGSYAKNVLHALWPRLYRMPYIASSTATTATDVADTLLTLDELIVGAQVAGADVVGDFPIWNATVLYDIGKKHWGYQFGIENNFFSPVKQTIQYTNLDEKSFQVEQYVPFLQKLNYGLTSAQAGFGFSATRNYRYKLWYPFLGLNFAARGLRLATSNVLLYETMQFLPSERERLGWQGSANLRLKAPLSTELRSNVFAAWDPDIDTKAEPVFPTLRGYTKDWPQNSGVMFSNSWYAPILKIRNGLWNPNIYLEDVNLGLFYDYALPGDGKSANTLSAYGLELIAEIFAGYSFALNLGVRFSWDRDGNPLTSLILGM